jgi:hypothetical protein
MRLIVLGTALALLLLPKTAAAYSLNGQQMANRWAASDRCAAAAQKQFPDYNPSSNLKRDKAMQQCLATGSLPPRGDLQHQ